MNRRDFLENAPAFAAPATEPAGVAGTAPTPRIYPYLGRTKDYRDFRTVDAGRKVAKVESWTQGVYGFVRVTTDDGHEGRDRMSAYEPDIAALVLHRPVARHAVGSDPARTDGLADHATGTNRGESLYALSVEVKEGRVQVPSGPGWAATTNPDWLSKAAYSKTEKSA